MNPSKTKKMKKNIFLITGLILLSAGLSFSACNSGFSGNNDQQDDLTSVATENDVNESNTTLPCIANIPAEPLNDAEKTGILFMREEEKLARDVYICFSDKTGIRSFGNILKAEQRHMDAVKALIDRYQLEDPAHGKETGEFTSNELQELYDKLIREGEASDIAALRVGALIEEKDILDLEKELEEHVDNRDITLVWDHLRKGSEAHLRAFVWNLKVRGITYEPVMMSREQFDRIINRK